MASAPASVSSTSSSVSCVSQDCPSRIPTTISGRIKRDSKSDVLEKAKEPKATGPVPGSSRGSVTSASMTRWRHQMSASRKRSGPEAVKRASSPNPTSPFSRRDQHRTSSRTRNDGSPPEDESTSRGTVKVRSVLVMMEQHYSRAQR
ncbi:hypothetical protein AHiyo1_00660 [Arthrobacter sp. Hiyo1]|nr:hypothetical protein AHiyo1_00660 [Arthrobacter sp. Hiyo1]